MHYVGSLYDDLPRGSGRGREGILVWGVRGRVIRTCDLSR